MPLPWVRLDSNIATHDKILALLDDASPKRWQAAFSYVSALGWCGGQGTGGIIRSSALGFVHGDKKTADLLCKYDLWHEFPGGWTIHNYATRQQTPEAAEATISMLSEAGKRGACAHWHAPGCWKEGEGCRGIRRP